MFRQVGKEDSTVDIYGFEKAALPPLPSGASLDLEQVEYHNAGEQTASGESWRHMWSEEEAALWKRLENYVGLDESECAA